MERFTNIIGSTVQSKNRKLIEILRGPLMSDILLKLVKLSEPVFKSEIECLLQ